LHFYYFTEENLDGYQVRLMLVLAPAACILSGIALSQAFDVFTRSIKFQLPSLSDNSQVGVSIISFNDHWLTSCSSGRYISLLCSNCVFDYQGRGRQF